MLIELEERKRIVHEDIRVEHEELLQVLRRRGAPAPIARAALRSECCGESGSGRLRRCARDDFGARGQHSGLECFDGFSPALCRRFDRLLDCLFCGRLVSRFRRGFHRLCSGLGALGGGGARLGSGLGRGLRTLRSARFGCRFRCSFSVAGRSRCGGFSRFSRICCGHCGSICRLFTAFRRLMLQSNVFGFGGSTVVFKNVCEFAGSFRKRHVENKRRRGRKETSGLRAAIPKNSGAPFAFHSIRRG